MNNPTFGEVEKDIQYKHRPGAYGILIENGLVALVETPEGYHLPGGGMNAEESLEDCLRRELLEECGVISPISFEKIGQGFQYVHAKGEGYFKKEEVFLK